MKISIARALSHCNMGRYRLLLAAVAAVSWLILPEASDAATSNVGPREMPNLSGYWQHGPISVWQPLPFQPGPTRDITGPLDPTDVHVLFRGDPSNPILQPWAARELQRIVDLETSGKHPVINPQELCLPSGVLSALHLPGPMQILQEPGQVTILHQRDHQMRRIHLDREHSENIKPSWYGESVGYYEFDTLVVSTKGFNGLTPADMFGTPTTDQLHVVERFRLIDNGNRLEITVTVDDPGAFTTEWPGRVIYNRAQVNTLEEEICAENNRATSVEGQLPVPTEGQPVPVLGKVITDYMTGEIYVDETYVPGP